MKNTAYILLAIFLLAFLIRFLYFPDNINFAYDQARDSFAALEILKGDLKIIGPPSASEKFFHGPLFYYFLAPVYFLFGSNVEIAAAFLRFINAVGVFLVFYISLLILNKEVGLIAAFLYAISYEQSQYSIFFGHPSSAVITVLFFYLGLAFLIFKNRPLGFVLSLISLGLTIQLHLVNSLLIIVLILSILFYYKKKDYLNLKIVLLGIKVFLIIISTFILAELKYNFRAISAIISTVTSFNTNSSVNFVYIFSVIQRMVNDNFFANTLAVNFLIIVFILSFIRFFSLRSQNDRSKTGFREKGIFLGLWFLGGLLPHFIATKFSYYYSPGASISLLILVSFLIYQLFLKNKFFASAIMILIIVSNLNLILIQNVKGVNSDFVIQPGMILGNQKKLLDYIYNEASGEPFAVNALTIPLNIKTTWDYLFNWYGREKYDTIPVWYGNTAEGFYGELPVIATRSDVPSTQFLIIEPTVGISEETKKDFLKEEGYFTKVVEEKTFGTIIVQKREKF